MFHLEMLEGDEWKTMSLPDFKSSEYAKAALRREWERRHIPRPKRGSVRIVGGNCNKVYFIYAGMTATLRFRWRAK